MGKDSALYFMPLKETVQPQNDSRTRTKSSVLIIAEYAKAKRAI